MLSSHVAIDIELCRKRQGVHGALCVINKRYVIIRLDGARQIAVANQNPNVFAHEELVQIPPQPILIQWVGLKRPRFLISRLLHKRPGKASESLPDGPHIGR